MKKLNSLEKAVIQKFLESLGMDSLKEDLFQDISIKTRDLTGSGFMTRIKTPNLLHCRSLPAHYKGGNIGARINDGEIEAGFVIYLIDNDISEIEGYDTRSE